MKGKFSDSLRGKFNTLATIFRGFPRAGERGPIGAILWRWPLPAHQAGMDSAERAPDG
jgi:hypothetical protein